MIISLQNKSIVSDVFFLEDDDAKDTWRRGRNIKKNKSAHEYDMLSEYFQINEIIYKSNKKITDGNKDALRDLYCQNVESFTLNEKKKWTQACYKANYILKKKLNTTIKWKIILLGNDMDWMLPYTLGDTIIIPTKQRKKYCHKMLVHEAIHILQKGKMKMYFEKKNIEYGFTKVNHTKKLLEFEHIRKRIITNMDGLFGLYICEIENDTFISPLVLLNKKGGHASCYVYVKRNGDILYGGKIFDLTKNVDYKKMLRKDVFQCYHPAEILAETLSKY
jgi:hypothetical protein